MAKRAAPIAPEPGVDHAKLTRDLETVARRCKQTEQAHEQNLTQRDRVIRDAHAAGITPTRIGELTELTTARVDQIRRGGRV